MQFGALLRLCAPDTTTVSVVHDPDLVASLAARVIGLRAGRLVLDKAATDVDDEDLDRVYRR